MVYHIYTDGSTYPNPGKSAYAGLILNHLREPILEYCEAYSYSTNNRMELQAILTGLSLITNKSTVIIYTDSQYCVYTLNRLISKKNNKKIYKNMDIIHKLRHYTCYHNVSWVKVKAHSGNKYNDYVDKLSYDTLQSLRSEALL